MSTITFLWPNRQRRYRLITILLLKFALSNTCKYLESKKHTGRAAFSAQSQKRLIYYNGPGRQ